MRDLVDGSGAILPLRVSNKGVQIKSSGNDALALIDISDAPGTPVMRFNYSQDRILSDGYADIFLGVGNGNPNSQTVGGNIAIGGNNLTSITPSGSFLVSPWWSTFRGDRNIAIGSRNGRMLKGDGSNRATGNILFGQFVLENSVSNSYNIFMGFQTAQNFNVAPSGTNGNENIAIGNYTMLNVVSGLASLNIVLGEAAVKTATSIGRENTILGPGAFLQATIIGDRNVAIGASAMREVAWTSINNGYNVAIGIWPLYYAIEGTNESTAVGFEAMKYGGGLRNQAFGNNAGYKGQGTDNTYIGSMSAFCSDLNYNAGTGTAFTGARSTFIGYKSGYTPASAAVNDVLVAGNVQPVLVKLYIGDAATDGSWKFVVSGADLVIQKRVAGAYVTKSTIVGA
jgi:hypothetical protein